MAKISPLFLPIIHLPLEKLSLDLHRAKNTIDRFFVVIVVIILYQFARWKSMNFILVIMFLLTTKMKIKA